MAPDTEIYQQAQHAVAELKSAVLRLLVSAGKDGLRNSQVVERSEFMPDTSGMRGTYRVLFWQCWNRKVCFAKN